MDMITTEGLLQTILEVLAHGHTVTESQLYALVVSELAAEYRKGVTEAKVTRLVQELALAGRIDVDNSGIDGLQRYCFSVSDDAIQRNTEELFKYLADAHVRAAASQASPGVRAVLIESAKDSEWYVLFAAMTVPAQRRIYDGMRIGKRLEALRAAL